MKALPAATLGHICATLRGHGSPCSAPLKRMIYSHTLITRNRPYSQDDGRPVDGVRKLGMALARHLVGDGKMQGKDADEFNPWTVIREEVKHDCPHFTTRRDIVSFSGRTPRPYDSIRAKLHGVCGLQSIVRATLRWSANSDTCKGAILGSYPGVVGHQTAIHWTRPKGNYRRRPVTRPELAQGYRWGCVYRYVEPDYAGLRRMGHHCRGSQARTRRAHCAKARAVSTNCRHGASRGACTLDWLGVATCDRCAITAG